MSTTSSMSIQEFSDALASGESTPGGGGAAALTGSQAAALVSMVINFTIGKKKYAAVQEEMESLLQQSEALRAELLALADSDVEAFNAVTACYGMPKSTDEEKAARTAAMQDALKGAAKVPFTVAERSLEVIRLADPVGEKGNKNVVSDAASAIYLAASALNCAIVNVNINLKFIKDEAFNEELSAKRDTLLAEFATVYESAKVSCENTLGVTL